MSNKETIKNLKAQDDTKFLKTKDLMTSARAILDQAKQAQAANQTPQDTQPTKK